MERNKGVKAIRQGSGKVRYRKFCTYSRQKIGTCCGVDSGLVLADGTPGSAAACQVRVSVLVYPWVPLVLSDGSGLRRLKVSVVVQVQKDAVHGPGGGGVVHAHVDADGRGDGRVKRPPFFTQRWWVHFNCGDLCVIKGNGAHILGGEISKLFYLLELAGQGAELDNGAAVLAIGGDGGRRTTKAMLSWES